MTLQTKLTWGNFILSAQNLLSHNLLSNPLLSHMESDTGCWSLRVLKASMVSSLLYVIMETSTLNPENFSLDLLVPY